MPDVNDCGDMQDVVTADGYEVYEKEDDGEGSACLAIVPYVTSLAIVPVRGPPDSDEDDDEDGDSDYSPDYETVPSPRHGSGVVPGRHLGNLTTLHDDYRYTSVNIRPAWLRPKTIMSRRASSRTVLDYVDSLSKADVQNQARIIVKLAMRWPSCWARVSAAIQVRRRIRFARARAEEQRLIRTMRGLPDVQLTREWYLTELKDIRRGKYMHF
jgi:hypothetical protein